MFCVFFTPFYGSLVGVEQIVIEVLFGQCTMSESLILLAINLKPTLTDQRHFSHVCITRNVDNITTRMVQLIGNYFPLTKAGMSFADLVRPLDHYLPF